MQGPIPFFSDIATKHGVKISYDPQSEEPVAVAQGLRDKLRSWFGGVSKEDAMNNSLAITLFDVELQTAYGTPPAHDWNETLQTLIKTGKPLTSDVVREVLRQTEQRAAEMRASKPDPQSA